MFSHFVCLTSSQSSNSINDIKIIHCYFHRNLINNTNMACKYPLLTISHYHVQNKQYWNRHKLLIAIILDNLWYCLHNYATVIAFNLQLYYAQVYTDADALTEAESEYHFLKVYKATSDSLEIANLLIVFCLV